MTTPKDVLWLRDPHTGAKHQMLDAYLRAWFPIIAAGFRGRGFTYAEGFAGPGEYLGGEEGSPLLAIRQALRPDVLKHRTPIRVVCVEKDKRRFNHLADLISTRFPNLAMDMEFTPVCGDCQTDLLPTLDRIGAFDGPIFANLDGWGVDTPFEIVKRIGQCRSSEVLITVQSQWFIRFANQEDIAAGDRVFGDSRWRAVKERPTAELKRRFLIDEYLRRLSDVGFPYTLTFELIDEGGHELLLVFGTASELGVEKMKDALWKVDPVSGERFRDPRDPNQMSFAIDEPNFVPLRKELLGQLDNGDLTVAELKKHALLGTIYKQTHAVEQLRALADEGKVEWGPGRRHEEITVSLAPPTLFDV